jgi:endonuclease/exonuclease/phosphatase family metal-dependent hydrolase
VPPPAPKYTMIMGDFNSTENSHEHLQFAEPSDPQYGRLKHSGDLVDSWAVGQLPKKKLGASPNGLIRLIEHPDIHSDWIIFFNAELSSLVSKAWVDAEATESDHKPNWIELSEEIKKTDKKGS